MSAIVTKDQRIDNANAFMSAFSDSPIENHLYLFLAKTDYWSDDLTATADDTVETPIDGETHKSAIYNEMIAMKKVNPENLINVAPTIKWEYGAEYTAWDDSFSELIEENGIISYNTIFDKNFYVITSTYNLYKCLVSGSSISTIQPSHTGIEPLQYSDGYVWHYIYTLPPANVLTFFNDSFFPVESKTSQNANQSNIEGGIFKIIVTDGGTGYTTPPSVTIEGDGTGASATALISNGAVSSVTIDLTDSIVESGKYGLKHGTNYNYAKINFSGGGGSGAKARAVLSPRNGHGSDPIYEFGAYNVEIAVNIDDDEGGDFIVTNDYRKLGLIKNPYNSGSPSDVSTSTTLNCLKSIEVNTGTFNANDIIQDTTTLAYAYVDYVDSDNKLIYYHQNEKTGYKNFGIGNTIICSETSESGVIVSFNDSEYEPFTGNILLIENRDPIQRSATTREEIRMVLQF